MLFSILFLFPSLSSQVSSEFKDQLSSLMAWHSVSREGTKASGSFADGTRKPTMDGAVESMVKYHGIMVKDGYSMVKYHGIMVKVH